MPEIGAENDEDRKGTALTEAILQGHLKVVKKFRIDPAIDNLDALLHHTGLRTNARS